MPIHPSRELTEILALVPPDFADPDADYRAVRAMMAPFHGHPVPAHVSVTEVELGGVRCAWY
jgi:monoterpene epsilon-lactone hydrolase